MPSPEAMQFAESLRTAPKQVDLDLAARRDAGEHAEDLTAEPLGVSWEHVDEQGVRGLWATPGAATDGKTVLYFVGGGHVLSTSASRRKLAGHIAAAAGARVFNLDYALAPEHPFPADVDDALRAYEWLLAHGQAPERLALGGDSSGGGLVMEALLALRSSGWPVPGAAFCVSPWVDLACTGESHRTNREHDLTCTTDSLLSMAGQYLGGRSPDDPAVAPLDADLSGLPPLLVLVGGAEILLDDAVRLVRRAGIDGASAELQIWPGMQHVFPLLVGVFPEAAAGVAAIGSWLHDALAPAAAVA